MDSTNQVISIIRNHPTVDQGIHYITDILNRMSHMAVTIFQQRNKQIKMKSSGYSDDLVNWMGNLPDLIREGIPIIYLAIPGTHYSGTYSINADSKLAPDASDFIRQIYAFSPWVLHRWVKTQKYTFKEQLQNGIRYFDLRMSTSIDDDKFYFVHGVYCDEVTNPLEEIRNFLIDHPKEFVILDCHQFYDFEPYHHQKFSDLLLQLFGTRIYERNAYEKDFSNLTLCRALNLHKQVIVVYRNENINKAFFESDHFVNPSPNVTDVKKLEKALDITIMSRTPYQGHVTQLVLIPNYRFIIARIYSSLRIKCAEEVIDNCKAFIESRKPGPFRDYEGRRSNIFIADFVDLDDNYFTKAIIDLNMKLLNP
ncbi:PI-PLC X domain-containing protein 3-like [Chironomus tepperi]|uniref:PI-PLC X domain-containing protein 3-like n=1 Tax=Chironomus tepperi TaxID=113505 RepID=UPI00391FAA12